MSQALLLPILAGLAAGGAVALIMVLLYVKRERASGEGIIKRARAEAEGLVASAVRDGSAAREKMVLDGRSEILKLREEIEKEAKQRRDEQARLERRIGERDRELEERARGLQQAERGVGDRDAALRRKEEELQGRIAEMDRLQKEELARLERLAGLSADEAKRELIARVEDEARSAAQALGREIREQAKRDAQKDARRIISMSIQRLAAESTAETTVAAVALPSDEMKGRIIGREGRNIRAFEQATGVDVIIDDTPDTVVISCFDPVRREVGRLALERLIADGRIHPGRIEEIVKKAKDDVDRGIVEAGEQAVYDIGIRGMHAELVKLVGRMKYRTL